MHEDFSLQNSGDDMGILDYIWMNYHVQHIESDRRSANA